MAVTVIVVAAALLIVWWRYNGRIGAQPAWESLAQAFLASSMRAQPVPGWRTSVTDLGLPGPAPDTAKPSKLATDEDPFNSSPYVGNLGDAAYFIAGSPGTSGTQWWLVGVGMRDGRRLFALVQLNDETKAPKCFVNGPNALLCLRNDPYDVVAWVIDAQTGNVSYTAPTDLRTYPAKLTVHQVGIYAVAETESQGVYGVGPNAQTTWFVPGDGRIDQQYVGARIDRCWLGGVHA